MFGYGYKEDALKWREHQKKERDRQIELDNAELSKVARMVCKVHLKGGDVIDEEITALPTLRHGYSMDYRMMVSKSEPYVEKASSKIQGLYLRLCERANTEGLHIDGSFYPSCQIKLIERGEIEVTTNET